MVFGGRTTRKLLVAIGVAFAAVVASGTAANADPGAVDPDKTSGAPMVAVLTPPKRVGTQALDPPGNELCYVYVYRPWLQGGGVVGTSAHTDCVSDEPEIHTSGEVWRSRWYGWQKMDEDPRTAIWNDHQSSYPSWYCGGTVHNWQGRSYHRVVWYSGGFSQTYIQATDTPRLTC